MGKKPLVLDWEFSYLWLYEAMVESGMNFVVRLNTGNRARITDGEEVFLEGVKYMGRVLWNLAGVWEKGQGEPLWVFTSLSPEEGLGVYRRRMGIGESFRDLGSLLHLERIVNKQRGKMEQMVALVLLAYC